MILSPVHIEDHVIVAANTIKGDMTLTGDLTVQGTTTTSGNETVTGDLDVQGTITVSVLNLNQHIRQDRSDISSNGSTDGSGVYSVDTSGGAVTFTLSTADSNDGAMMFFKRNGANTLTLDTEGSQTIGDSSTHDLTADNESVTLIFNATNSDWEIY